MIEKKFSLALHDFISEHSGNNRVTMAQAVGCLECVKFDIINDNINQQDIKEGQSTATNIESVPPCKGCNQVPTVKCLAHRLRTGNC